MLTAHTLHLSLQHLHLQHDASTAQNRMLALEVQRSHEDMKLLSEMLAVSQAAASQVSLSLSLALSLSLS